jgi:hypothetical protein
MIEINKKSMKMLIQPIIPMIIVFSSLYIFKTDSGGPILDPLHYLMIPLLFLIAVSVVFLILFHFKIVRYRFILFTILFLIFISYNSAQYPGIYGQDQITRNTQSALILQNNHIPQGDNYLSVYPSMPLLNGIIAEVLGVSPLNQSHVLGLIAIQITIFLFLYLIGRRISKDLAYIVPTAYILVSFYNDLLFTPRTLGFLFIVMLFYLNFKHHINGDRLTFSFKLILLLLLTVTAFTHLFSVIIIGIIIIGTLIYQLPHERLKKFTSRLIKLKSRFFIPPKDDLPKSRNLIRFYGLVFTLFGLLFIGYIALIDRAFLDRIIIDISSAFRNDGLQEIASKNWMGNTYEIIYSYLFEFQYTYASYPIIWFFRKIMFFGLIFLTLFWSLKFIKHKDVNYLLFLTLLIVLSIVFITLFIVGSWWERFFPFCIVLASCILIYWLKFYHKKGELFKFAVILLLPLIFTSNLQEAQIKEYNVQDFSAGNFLYYHTNESLLIHNVSSFGFTEFSEVSIKEGISVSEIKSRESPRLTYLKTVDNILSYSNYTKTNFTMRSYRLDLSMKNSDFTANEEMTKIDDVLASQNRIYDNGYTQVFSKK